VSFKSHGCDISHKILSTRFLEGPFTPGMLDAFMRAGRSEI